jgi:uncharacterized protein with von Willebrand factor type A (vWA) domain
MLIPFFLHLRSARLPVSVREFLTLLEALKSGLIDTTDAVDAQGNVTSTLTGPTLDTFYLLARTTLVKDEAHYDRFDRAFGEYFRGVDARLDLSQEVPFDWLRKTIELDLDPAARAAIEAMGWDELMEALKQRFEEQKDRHQGGSKMIGTAGTSPFGAWGFNPQGIRIGQDKSRHRRAVKVWDQRLFKDYDGEAELGTRQIQVALRRLRRFARQGSPDELDLDDTIRATAANAGRLDLKMVPERHNHIKVLLLMDVGGSMDEHVHRVEQMFTAARSAFKHLEFFYFHNCVYDVLWRNNARRHAERFATWDVLRKYNRDHKLIFVGDATMSPYEILQPGGSVEYANEEPGAQWLQRLTQAFPSFAWINPEPQALWGYRQSVTLVRQLMNQRMYPLTLPGLDAAMRSLSR